MRPFISTNVSCFLMGSLHENEMLGLIMLNRYDIHILLLLDPYKGCMLLLYRRIHKSAVNTLQKIDDKLIGIFFFKSQSPIFTGALCNIYV